MEFTLGEKKVAQKTSFLVVQDLDTIFTILQNKDCIYRA
jgi:hypothetical protein